MKKSVWIMTIALCSVLLVCAVFVVWQPPRHKSLSVYELTYEQVTDFLNAPSKAYLESHTVKYDYSVDEQGDKTIVRHGTDAGESADEGVFRIAQTPVYASLIHAWSDEAQVQRFLQSHNVSEHVDDVVFLACNDLPCCIGLCAESAWYFVTINEYDDDLLQETRRGSYVYRLYTRREMMDKLKTVDADLFVNSEKVLSVNKKYNDADIPVIALCKQLGADVRWDGDAVLMRYRDEIVWIDTASRNIRFQDGTEHGIDAPGGGSHVSVQGADVYLDLHTTADVLRRWGFTMHWDREGTVITVNG